MIDFTVEFLLAALELLKLLQTFPRRVADDDFLVLQLLAFSGPHPSLVSVLGLDL